jgi:glycosyltransferase involved in cell wall biosynthesis
MPDLAVAVATRNRPAGVRRCVDALLSGTLPPAQIIVIDQSHDGETAAVLRACPSSPRTRITYVRQHVDGLSRSRNAALALVKGNLLAVTDDDCVPDRTWAEVIVREFSRADAPDALTGRVLPLGPETAGLAAVSSRTGTERRDFRDEAEPWDVGTGANFAARCEWLVRVGAFDERLGSGTRGGAGEDIDLLHRLLRGGARIRYEPDAVVYHARQPLVRRAATRLSYGRGIGACCGLWLRDRDRSAPPLLAAWCRLRLRRAAAAARRRNLSAAAEEWAVLRGTAAGLAYGLLVRSPRRDGGVPA